MSSDSEFWQLQHLSNQQLLDSLAQVLRNQRRSLAELVAHLVEVEERRLHLEAAHGSLFDYCVRKLHMSEDEACRRIDLARLARRFPALFPLLAGGEITLSAALVLKPVLTSDNHLELIAARGKSIQQTRELVAARFPSPDVLSTIRKLPEPKAAPASAPRPQPVAPLFAASNPPAASYTTPRVDAPAPSAAADLPQSNPSQPVPPPRVSASLRLEPRQQSIEPLAAERYKLQLTIDAAIKTQLETARDLLRHANPSGDFALILSRALDLLIADLLRQRFGVSTRRKVTRERTPTPQKSPAASTSPSATSPSSTTHIPHATRRAVLDRDGFACTWVDANGTRCNSRAWLELDHRHPRGKGGSSEAANIRVLCRAHNQLAAEHTYGRAHIERAQATRRARKRSVPGEHDDPRCAEPGP